MSVPEGVVLGARSAGIEILVWPEATSSSGTGFEDVPNRAVRALTRPGIRLATLLIETITRLDFAARRWRREKMRTFT